MASVFGHIVASSAIGLAGFPRQANWKTLALAGLCAALPDADVIGFHFGVSYMSIWGHRGWTHSLCFALVWGILVAWLFYGRDRDWWKMACWLVLATASHPLLDMLTTGGMGCALWWPFSEERLFFPVRVIRVSPLEIRSFISQMGLRILLNEAFWIGAPSVLLVLFSQLFRKQAA
ncbi:MAG: metal-dependent hydrolase [Saprospiraceae bacterium]|nr:metal-dependent hydrolase [Saprospiraceae bacterium]